MLKDRRLILLVLLMLLLLSGVFLLYWKRGEARPSSEEEGSKSMQNTVYQMGQKQRAEIYLAAGCFWGSEAYFKRVPGILETEVGYANGKTETTRYADLSRSGHAETVRLVYDPGKIHLAEILERFFRIIDPLSLNRQGNDIGTQYRSGIYYRDGALLPQIELSLEVLEKRLGKKTAIECQPLNHFIPAEDYHQDYLDKNPGGYCHINLADAELELFPGAVLEEEKLQKELPQNVYEVTRKKGTEAPFSSPLDGEGRPGIYVDRLSGKALFSSDDKYDAGCGWPSFTMPITTDAAVYLPDHSHGMQRVEVEGKGSGSHLGHVFPDGPAGQGGLRYCINGLSLRFIPLEEMEKEGYIALLPFVGKR